MREAPPLPNEQKYDPAKAYTAHRQALLRDMPDAEPSRLDAYIALRMREKGFTQEAVLQTILQCALKPKADRRNEIGGAMRNGRRPMLLGRLEMRSRPGARLCGRNNDNARSSNGKKKCRER
jgi:hypothetical protein